VGGDTVGLLALAISTCWYVVLRLDLSGRRSVTQDGFLYLQAGRGLRVPSPFTRRWLLPLLLRDKIWRWDLVSSASMIACGPLIAAYVPGEGWERLAAVGLFLGCTGLVRFNTAFPVNVDAAGMALALGAAICVDEYPVAGVVLALAGGSCIERSPVFAAIFAGSPLPLLGLLAPAWFRRGALASEPWFATPFQHALKHHSASWLSWRDMLAPWGAIALLAPLGAGLDRPTLLAAIAVLVGYGQMLIATDRARLYQWAAPAVIAIAVRAVPPSAAALIVLVHLFNPYRIYDPVPSGDAV
jgi:hypothetical protein